MDPWRGRGGLPRPGFAMSFTFPYSTPRPDLAFATHGRAPGGKGCGQRHSLEGMGGGETKKKSNSADAHLSGEVRDRFRPRQQRALHLPRQGRIVFGVSESCEMLVQTGRGHWPFPVVSMSFSRKEYVSAKNLGELRMWLERVDRGDVKSTSQVGPGAQAWSDTRARQLKLRGGGTPSRRPGWLEPPGRAGRPGRPAAANKGRSGRPGQQTWSSWCAHHTPHSPRSNNTGPTPRTPYIPYIPYISQVLRHLGWAVCTARMVCMGLGGVDVVHEVCVVGARGLRVVWCAQHVPHMLCISAAGSAGATAAGPDRQN
eukprot:gene13371-biopygen20025